MLFRCPVDDKIRSLSAWRVRALPRPRGFLRTRLPPAPRSCARVSVGARGRPRRKGPACCLDPGGPRNWKPRAAKPSSLSCFYSPFSRVSGARVRFSVDLSVSGPPSRGQVALLGRERAAGTRRGPRLLRRPRGPPVSGHRLQGPPCALSQSPRGQLGALSARALSRGRHRCPPRLLVL